MKNDTGDDIRFREYGLKPILVVPSGQRHSIEFLRAESEPQLLLSYSRGSTEWFVPFATFSADLH